VNCTSCQSGACKTPTACQVPEHDEPPLKFDEIGPWIATGAVVVLCVIALIVWATFTVIPVYAAL
jgi:hypothetical protein